MAAPKPAPVQAELEAQKPSRKPLLIALIGIPVAALAAAGATFGAMTFLGGEASSASHGEAAAGHGEEAAAGGHGEEAAAGGHGEAPAGGHGEAPAEGHGEEAAGGHGEAAAGGHGEGAAKPEKKVSASDRAVMPLGTFTINLRGAGGGRVLRMEVHVETGVISQDAITENNAKLRDAVVTLVSDYSYADLEGLDGKTRLRDELLARMNALLGKDNRIERLYFTEFVIQ